MVRRVWLIKKVVVLRNQVSDLPFTTMLLIHSSTMMLKIRLSYGKLVSLFSMATYPMGETLVFYQALKIFGLLQVQVEKFERLHADKHHSVFLVKQSK